MSVDLARPCVTTGPPAGSLLGRADGGHLHLSQRCAVQLGAWVRLLFLLSALHFTTPIYGENVGGCYPNADSLIRSPREARLYQYQRLVHWDPSSVPPLTWSQEKIPRFITSWEWMRPGDRLDVWQPDTCGIGAWTIRMWNGVRESCDSNYILSH